MFLITRGAREHVQTVRGCELDTERSDKQDREISTNLYLHRSNFKSPRTMMLTICWLIFDERVTCERVSRLAPTNVFSYASIEKGAQQIRKNVQHFFLLV